MMKLCLVCALLMSLLFFLLSPGVFLTLTTHKKSGCGYWMELQNEDGGCATSYEAVGIHTAVFFFLTFASCCLVCKCFKVKA